MSAVVTLNLHQKLIAVRKAVAYVQKDKKVGDGGGYMAVTHDKVTAETREHFNEHGILIVPTLLASETVLTGTTTAKGVPFIRYEAKYRFDVVNADTPTDHFDMVIEAHAIDQGDKAPGKALSYAKKYAVLKLLEIESGEEEEAREEQKFTPTTKVTPNAGAGDVLTAKQKGVIADTAIAIKDALSESKDWDAYQLAEGANFDLDEKLYLWAQLDSKERSALKRMGEAERKKQKELDAKGLQ